MHLDHYEFLHVQGLSQTDQSISFLRLHVSVVLKRPESWEGDDR